MSATEKIESAAEALVQTIKENGYRIDDLPVDDIREDQVELFRYPPEEYHTAVCAVSDEAAAQPSQDRPPTYTTAPKDGESTAQLSMNDWQAPHTWQGPAKAPNHWPHAAVDNLVQLFTGRGPDASAHGAVPLPAPAARHIAVLIEDWCTNSFDQDEPDPGHNAPSSAIGCLNARRQRAAHIQAWYGQGITLYQIWSAQPR